MGEMDGYKGGAIKVELADLAVRRETLGFGLIRIWQNVWRI
jgi:hypothetical protein